MLVPKRVKHRKEHRGNMKGRAKGGTEVAFGEYGLQALEPAWVTNRQIEAARIAMTRYIKRGGKVWIKIFPSKPITQKPLEVRMGSGKGNLRNGLLLLNQAKFCLNLLAYAKKSLVKLCVLLLTNFRSRRNL